MIRNDTDSQSETDADCDIWLNVTLYRVNE